MAITGNTRICGILADPVHQVRTPEAFNELMKRWSVDAVMVPMHVSAAGLPKVMEAVREMQNFAGFIATIPHKSATVEFCDEVTDRAAAVGAVNAVRREADGRLVGEILDGVGFVLALRAKGVELRDRRVFLAGAGGTANAVAFALAEAGIGSLAISNRTVARSADLMERLNLHHPALTVTLAQGDPTGSDIAINATSLGLAAGDVLPFDAERLLPSQVVAEVIMKPAVTPLLEIAQRRGCTICPGAPMLEHQLELMARFMGIEP